jgi:ketosteroid isomerase-like protein
MPDPPATSPLTRYLFENPWPGTLGLGLIGILLLWRALAGGQRRLLLFGIVAVALAAANLRLSVAVTTAGEHAKQTVRELVAAAVDADIAAASALFEPDAIINFDRPENPSLGRATIDRGLESLAGRNRVESNSTTLLKGFTLDDGTGLVHLGCWTRTASSMANTPSQWVLRVRRQPDGAWQISRVTCVSIAGRQVGSAVW